LSSSSRTNGWLSSAAAAAAAAAVADADTVMLVPGCTAAGGTIYAVGDIILTKALITTALIALLLFAVAIIIVYCLLFIVYCYCYCYCFVHTMKEAQLHANLEFVEVLMRYVRTPYYDCGRCLLELHHQENIPAGR
jgi:hypothetical protein